MPIRKYLCFDRDALKILLVRHSYPHMQAFARRHDISSTAMHNLFWGKVPKPELRDKIAKALSVDVSHLWREVEFTSVVF